MSTVLARSAAVLQAADTVEQKITRELSLAEQRPVFDWLEQTWDEIFGAYYPNDPYGMSADFNSKVQEEILPDLFRVIDTWIMAVYAPGRDSAWGFSGTVRYLLASYSYDEQHDELACLICQKHSTNWPSNSFFTWFRDHSVGPEPTVARQLVNAQSLVGGPRD